MKKALFPLIMTTLMSGLVTGKPINDEPTEDGQPKEYDIHDRPRYIKNIITPSACEQRIRSFFSIAKKRLKSEGISTDDPAYHHLLTAYVMEEYDKT